MLFEGGWWAAKVLRRFDNEFQVCSSINRSAFAGLEGTIGAPRLRPAWKWAGLDTGGGWRFCAKERGTVHLDAAGRLLRTVHERTPAAPNATPNVPVASSPVTPMILAASSSRVASTANIAAAANSAAGACVVAAAQPLLIAPHLQPTTLPVQPTAPPFYNASTVEDPASDARPVPTATVVSLPLVANSQMP